jgi:hypothetical protein
MRIGDKGSLSMDIVKLLEVTPPSDDDSDERQEIGR